MREYLILNGQTTDKRRAVPTVLRGWRQFNGFAEIVECAQPHNVPRKFAQHITACNPIGHEDLHAVLEVT